MDKKRNSVEFKITGRYALFADPITRVGGEKFTYQIPTYQALKGILESVYWKPTFIWYIDAVRVMTKIQTESKGIKPIKMSGGNDLSYYTYLRGDKNRNNNLEYQVLAHFEWNEYRKELDTDRDENKHHNIAKRSIIKEEGETSFLEHASVRGTLSLAFSVKVKVITMTMESWISVSCSMDMIIPMRQGTMNFAFACGGQRWKTES